MATYKNYSISAGKGKLYLKEKQPTENYEEITYGTENKKTYHRYFDSVKGLPTYFGTKEVSYDGKTLRFLELTLVDGDEHNKISVPLKNTKNGYSDESRAIISALNSLKMGEPITFTTKSTTTTGKNGKEYKNLNIYVNYVNIMNDDNKGLSTGFIPYAEIPAPDKKTVAGDVVYDWSPQTEFFYERLQEIEKRFADGGSSQPAPKVEKAPLTATPEQAFEKPKAESKLPF